MSNVNLNLLTTKKLPPPLVPDNHVLNCDPTYELEEMIVEARPLHKKKKRLLRHQSTLSGPAAAAAAAASAAPGEQRGNKSDREDSLEVMECAVIAYLLPSSNGHNPAWRTEDSAERTYCSILFLCLPARRRVLRLSHLQSCLRPLPGAASREGEAVGGGARAAHGAVQHVRIQWGKERESHDTKRDLVVGVEQFLFLESGAHGTEQGLACVDRSCSVLKNGT